MRPPGGMKISDAESGWSLLLPPGWFVASQEKLDVMNQAIRESGMGGGNLSYSHMFLTSESGPLDFPYILIQLSSVDLRGASYEDVERMFAAGTMQSGLQEAKDAFKDLDGSAPATPVFDRATATGTFQMNLKLQDVGEVTASIWMFLGKDRIVQVNCYSRADQVPSDFPVLQNIVSSFSFDPGRAFVPASGRPISPHGIGGVLGQIMVWGCVGAAVIGAGIWIRRIAQARSG